MTNPRDDLMALADRLRELVFRQGQIDWDALIKIEIDLRLAASRPATQVVDREAVAQAVTSELEKMHEDGVPMCMREGEATWRTYFAGFDLSMFAIRISDTILSLLRPAEPVEIELYRHRKRGTTYRILHGDEYGTCFASSSSVAQIDHEPMIVYQDIADGRVWVRPRSEFFDGRFEKLPRAAKPTTPDAVVEPVAWRARRLEWIERIGVDGTFDASTSIGHYIATITDDGRGMWFVVGLTTSNYIDGDISAVQFAAQSDYENRIRSAIEVAPHPPASPDTSVEEMRERCAARVEQFGQPYALNTNTGAMMFRAEVSKIAAAIRQLPTERGDK